MASVRAVCESAASARRLRTCHEPREETHLSEEGERARSMSIAELLETDEAKGLLESGRASGSLSTEEITLALSELELDAAQIDDFYHALEELQIDVVTDGNDDEEEPRAETREITTDSLQLFLKDIGKVDLLTAAQEV